VLDLDFPYDLSLDHLYATWLWIVLLFGLISVCATPVCVT
jgi:hypothetical protein